MPVPNRPLYMDIYDDLASRIKQGVYDSETPLPPERDLCASYHVSRSTVRGALRELQKNGLIRTIQGSGTFVQSQIIEQQLLNFYSFTDELKNRGTDFGFTIVDSQLISADDKLAQKMNCPKGSAIHLLVRLRCAASVPLMVEYTYLPQSRFHKINTSALPNSSLYEYLRSKYGLHMDHATETLQPILPSTREKDLLSITHTIPCMLLERFGYEEGALVEYTRSVVRGDKYIFKVRLDNRTNKPEVNSI